MKKSIIYVLLCCSIIACSEDTGGLETTNPIEDSTQDGNDSETDSRLLLEGKIDLDELFNYANQATPNYITKDNTGANSISDIEATLGRVLFYDKMLSVDGSVSCASCHKQEFAFGDREVQSLGVNDLTGRHSMRLVNARFGEENKFFWDERAASLEIQTTMPIKDHGEMGFSGENGDPSFENLIERLSGVDYYTSLFNEAYGDQIITEQRIQNALSQFIRSIQSFDSKYDQGREQAMNSNMDFVNFSNQENRGKRLFTQAPQFQGQSGNRIGGGLGCNGCHRAPEFDIDPNSRNNGVIGIAGSDTGMDLNSTRSPSLRDLFSSDGGLNTTLMHTGAFLTIEEVLDHYDNINREPGNDKLDQRLSRGGGVSLNMTAEEKADIVAFLKTLTGEMVYTEEKWSNPFE